MTYPVSNQAYAISAGASKIGAPIFSPSDPANTDVSFPIQQRWVNTNTQAIWILESLAPSNGVVYAVWRSVAPVVLKTVDPTTSDYLYPLGQIWGNTTSHSFFMLINVSGTTATWDVVAGPSLADISTITGNSGGAVTGDGSGNVNLLGSSGQVVVTGNPGTNTLTISLAGGGTAVDSFAPDTGTNPVVPTALGLVNVKGQSTPNVSGIQVTGGTNLLSLSMFSPFEGDFTFNQSNTSSTSSVKVLVNNADTSHSSSHAQFIASVGSTSSGDPSLIFSDQTHNWSFGIHTGTSGNVQICPSSSLGTPNWAMTTAGVRTLPLQPVFRVYLSANQTNATGDGTLFTIPFDSALSNVGSYYNLSTHVFTIPATGNYYFQGNIQISNIDVTHTSSQGDIRTGANVSLQTIFTVNPAAVRTNSNNMHLSGGGVFPYTAGDQVVLNISVFNGAKTITVVSGSNTTTFSGYLIG